MAEYTGNLGPDVMDHIYGTIYGHCIGDAIGLLTEFMPKAEAHEYYGQHVKQLEYSHKVADFHRSRWKTGDWTDDSDQMIMIMRSLTQNGGKVVPPDLAGRLKSWMESGFPELGDVGGMGLGRTTSTVMRHPEYLTEPQKAAEVVWDASQRNIAPNGGVMRTSVLGLHNFRNLDDVTEATAAACKVTHFDPRCVASCVAVTTAIAQLLQHFARCQHGAGPAKLDVSAIEAESFRRASALLGEGQKEEFKQHMYAAKLKDLQLAEPGKIGYTLKAMGSGFWALRQRAKGYRAVMTDLIMEGGDADSNGAVAGAMLGCVLGYSHLPISWRDNLAHSAWLDEEINKFLVMSIGAQGKPEDSETS